MAKLTDMLMNEKEAKDFIVRNFGKQLDLLSELREYGLNLLSRCYLSKPVHTIRDDVVFGILFRHVLMMLDSVHILLKEGAVVASFLPARSLFKTSLFLDWILQNEGNEKFYFVWNLRQQRLSLEKEQSANKDEKASKNISSAIARIEELLSTEEYREIDRRFEEIQELDRLHREPEWYEPAGMKSVGDIAEAVSRLEEYASGKNDFSETVFSVPYPAVGFDPIRHPVQITLVLPLIFNVVTHQYRSVIVSYREAELNDFRIKCLTEWQTVIDDMPVIQTAPQDTSDT